MGLFSRRPRIVVTNLFVALDTASFADVLTLCTQAEARIAEGGADFRVASDALAQVCGALLDRLANATHAACFGEVFDREDEAFAFGQACFADLSSRYLAAPDTGTPAPAEPGERRAVVMLTAAFNGEQPALEGALDSGPAVEAALRALVALHHQDALLVAHIHHAPAHPDDRLTDEQMLVNYPELLSL